MMHLDPEKVAAVIVDIAEREIAPRFGQLKPEEIREKSSASDLVTEVDEATERALTIALSDLYPGATVIGEESAAANPKLGDALQGDGVFWIVDPLDGTRNFVQGRKEFGTIVALVENGVTRMGWIYAVPEQKCAIAVEGSGANWDGVTITPKQSTAEADNGRLNGLRSIGWLTPDWKKVIVDNLSSEFSTNAHHCSAYGYLMTALGEVDFKLSSSIHPWDHAAGALLVAETGGQARFVDDFSDYKPAPSDYRPLLVSASGRDWQSITDTLRKPV